MNEPATATVTLTDPVRRLANGNVQETVIDVTITSAAHHTAYLLNAAAVAADEGLRAVSLTHPAHRPDQCGRTRPHAAHETTEGRCAGLESGDVQPGDVETLRNGLEVIAAGGCQVYGPEDDCFERGRVADGCRAACSPCIAAKVLAGEPLPMEADRA